MSKRKTWPEMIHKFPDEWLLINEIQRDEFGNFKSSIVKRHSKDKEEVYRLPSLDKPTAFRFTGESSYSGLRSHAQISHFI
jgi:hypothetical protein